MDDIVQGIYTVSGLKVKHLVFNIEEILIGSVFKHSLKILVGIIKPMSGS